MTNEKKHSILIKIKEKSNIFGTETINVSLSGVYCRSNNPVPLMSEVAITLVVPEITEGEKTNKTIECKGTIVRTHPVIIDGKTTGYDLAIFFNELKDEDRHLISHYINQTSDKEKEEEL